MSDICDSLLVVIQALLLLFLLLVLLLFWLLLVLLLVLRNPNCVPTPDPRKIKDGRNPRIVCDVGVDVIKGLGVVVVAPLVVVIVLASAGLLLWLFLLL